MSHSNIIEDNISPLKKIWIKLLLSIGLKMPLNSIRVSALRLCGFSIGKNVYIGGGLTVATILGSKKCQLKIGNRVALGPNITLLLSSDANWSKINNVVPPLRGTIEIQDDSWIGAGVIVMPNITIEKSSIVGAGAVVTKDVPSYSVVVGVPAKIIKKIEEKS